MCGLFGWQLSEATSSMPVLSATLKYAMAGRGRDSWGVLANGTKVVKGLGSITEADYPRRIDKLSSVAGHTRFGTTGENTKENAHPFQCGQIIGMHNGIVNNHASLNARFDRDCAVDSMHIFRHIDEDRPLSDITGYGAIVWARVGVPSSLYMGRFNAGELSVARIKDGSKHLGIAWASTRESLEAAVAMAGLKAAFIQIADGAVYHAKGGELYSTDRALDIVKQTTKWVAKSASTLPWPETTEDDAWAKGDWHYRDGKWDKDPQCSTCYDYMDRCDCTDCFCPACVDDGDWRKWVRGESEKVG